MAKKKSRSKSQSSTSRTPLLILVAIVVIAVVVLGVEGALPVIEQLLGIDLPDLPVAVGDATQAPVVEPPVANPSSGGSSAFTVYFTDPVIPFNDVTTGGIENHLIDLINSAQTSIVGAMFEFNLQNVADALIAAHNRGVDVRIVYDDEHTEDDPQIEELVDAGILATPDERSAFMHNKFFVFDNQIVWTGSWNVTMNGSYRNNNNAIAIRSTRLAQNYATEFEEMFNGEFGPRSPANTPNPSVTIDGVLVENYFSPEDEPMPKLIALVESAQTSIHFLIFSFTDDDLAQAMLDRAAAGVQVAGIFESTGANTEFAECPTLLDAGLDIRLDSNPRTFHHKVIIVDGSAVAIGSFNFSNNAAESNDENLIIVHDAGVAGQYEAEFNKQLGLGRLPVGGECLGE